MVCPICRTVILGGSTQCPACRSPLDRPPSIAPQPSAVERAAWLEHPDVVYQPSRSRAPAFALGGALLLLGAAAICALIWRHAIAPSGPMLQPLANRERILSVGDMWKYRMKADAKLQDTKLAHVEAINRLLVWQDMLDGRPTMVLSGTADFARSSPMPTFRIAQYFQQDPQSGDVTVLACKSSTDNLFHRVVNPFVIAPGAWSPTRKVSWTTQDDTGAVERYSEEVIGTEAVSTDAGAFMTWKALCTYEIWEQGISLTGSATVWYAPQLGAPVKWVGRLEGPMGISIKGSFLLESTNVPLVQAPTTVTGSGRIAPGPSARVR